MLKLADECHFQLFESRDIQLPRIWEVKLYTPNNMTIQRFWHVVLINRTEMQVMRCFTLIIGYGLCSSLKTSKCRTTIKVLLLYNFCISG
jgi:hypothetical protein